MNYLSRTLFNTSRVSLIARCYSNATPTAVELNYDVFNEKSSSVEQYPPIVILHGLFGNKMNNRTVARKLNEKLQRDVYCVDLRNHGGSPHVEPHTYGALALDVLKFIKDHELQQPILVGHSMGAKTAMAACLLSGRDVGMLVSVDNSPINVQPGGKFIQYTDILKSIVRNPEIKTMKQADAELAKFEKNMVIRQFLLTNLSRGDGCIKSKVPLDIISNALVKGEISGWEYTSDKYRWGGPTLFVRGTQSNYVADEYIPEIGKFFPRFELRDIDSGHWVISEKPLEFMEVLCEFIERHEDL